MSQAESEMNEISWGESVSHIWGAVKGASVDENVGDHCELREEMWSSDQQL